LWCLHLSGGAEDEIRRRFASLHLSIDGFGSVKYVGTRTIKPPTVYTELQAIVQSRLYDHSLRSARQPGLVFQTLKVLCFAIQQEIIVFHLLLLF